MLAPLLTSAPAMVPMLLPSWFDPAHLIHALGNNALWGVAVMLFIECAIFPVLPGDSLLFTVGMFVAMTPPSITIGGMGKFTTYLVVCVFMSFFAVLGNLAGYYVGKFISPWLFKPRNGLMGRIFSQQHLQQAHDFFERYGSKALVLGRFVPFVRTFVTMVAGAAGMKLHHFISWTAVGGVIWVFGVTLLGYLLGNVSFVGNNIDLILVVIIVVSVLPMVVEYLRTKRKNQAEAAAEAQ